MTCGISRGRATGTLVFAFLALAAPAIAQTDLCTLPLAAPSADEIEATLETNVRGLGLRLTWPALDDATSTCHALLDTASLGIDVAIAGAYADEVDRMLMFTFADSGTVGSTTRNRLVVSWENMNRSLTGTIIGEINLSNTGGLWRYDSAAGGWTQQNDGLPRYLSYMNFDAFAASGGTFLAGISGANQPGIAPRGLYRAVGDAPWQAIGPAIFNRQLKITRVAIDPDDPAHFAVGTEGSGVYLTSDGGATFTQWRQGNGRISALAWTPDRLYAAVTGSGLFATEDGVNFSGFPSLVVPANLDTWDPGNPVVLPPQINRVVIDPDDSAHIFVLVRDHAIWHSTDGGATWSSLGGDWIVADPDRPGAWRHTGSSLHVDGDRLVVGTERQGLWFSTDGGQHWEASDTPTADDSLEPAYVAVVEADGALFAQGNTFGLLRSDDGGATFTLFEDQLPNRNALALTRDDDGALLMATWGGGIYLPGTMVPLTDSINILATDDPYDALQLGLAIAFGPGVVIGRSANGLFPGQQFRLNAQDFQGWVVWRSDRDAPDQMTMIGRYDKNNPESCIEGFCGDDSYVVVPNCFGERRAACFDFSVPGEIGFFDGDVYNGFSYYYAVTTYDYGDISMITDPIALATPLVHPDRFPGDPLGVGDGDGNRFAFEVNQPAAAPEDGAEIYVFPNPLRRDAGIVGGEGEEVRWANLPPESRVEVYTLAGDRIAELGGDDQHEGNMYWITRNDDGRLLASGIYLWRCIMPERNDFWGKLIIIR